MKGIVYEIGSGRVLYKFDTETFPNFNPGEAVKERPDINDIKVNAVYSPGDDTYTNPEEPPVRNFKAEFAAAGNDATRLTVIADFLNLR